MIIFKISSFAEQFLRAFFLCMHSWLMVFTTRFMFVFFFIEKEVTSFFSSDNRGLGPTFVLSDQSGTQGS